MEDKDNEKRPIIQKVYLMRLRYLVYTLLFITIAVAIVGPFIWQCIEKNQDAKEALAIWNGYISIVLGFVATTLSIVSMSMNFKTYDDAIRVQRQAERTLAMVDVVKEDVRYLRDHDRHWDVGRSRKDNNPVDWQSESIKTDEDSKYGE